MPPLLGMSYERNLAPTISSLQARLGLSEAELTRLVTKLPAVLGYSFERNVLPKLDYLQATLGLTDDELRLRVCSLPALLGYSVDKRYRPRIERCQRAGVPLLRVLDRIALTDERFNASVPLPLASAPWPADQ